MTVYVDDMFASYGRMKMCHMIADTHQELVDMADAIGLNRKHIQYPGTWLEHFDVSKGYRLRAIELGAKPITQRELGSRIRDRRKSPILKAWEDAASIAPDSPQKAAAIKVMVMFESSPEFEGKVANFRCCDPNGPNSWVLTGICEDGSRYNIGWSV